MDFNDFVQPQSECCLPAFSVTAAGWNVEVIYRHLEMTARASNELDRAPLWHARTPSVIIGRCLRRDVSDRDCARLPYCDEVLASVHPFAQICGDKLLELSTLTFSNPTIPTSIALEHARDRRDVSRRKFRRTVSKKKKKKEFSKLNSPPSGLARALPSKQLTIVKSSRTQVTSGTEIKENVVIIQSNKKQSGVTNG